MNGVDRRARLLLGMNGVDQATTKILLMNSALTAAKRRGVER